MPFIQRLAIYKTHISQKQIHFLHLTLTLGDLDIEACFSWIPVYAWKSWWKYDVLFIWPWPQSNHLDTKVDLDMIKVCLHTKHKVILCLFKKYSLNRQKHKQTDSNEIITYLPGWMVKFILDIRPWRQIWHSRK